MSIKIIATDLDGTLMAADHRTVTERTKKALLNAQNTGAKIAISTGRTLSFIDDVREQIPFIDYIIYSNGASVFDCKNNKVIYKNHISANKSGEILNLLDNYVLFYNVYADGKIYTKKGGYDFSGRSDMPSEFLEYFMSMNIQCDNLRKTLDGKSSELIVAYYINNNDRKTIIDYINGDNEIDFVSSVMDNVEIMSSTAGKGAALAGICKILGCTQNEVMCFGDANNDCSMLEYADYSFAMANGDESSKNAAKFIAESNADDGVAKAIEKYLLNY